MFTVVEKTAHAQASLEDLLPIVVSHTWFRALPLSSQFVVSGLEQGEGRVDSLFFRILGSPRIPTCSPSLAYGDFKHHSKPGHAIPDVQEQGAAKGKQLFIRNHWEPRRVQNPLKTGACEHLFLFVNIVGLANTWNTMNTANIALRPAGLLTRLSSTQCSHPKRPLPGFDVNVGVEAERPVDTPGRQIQ